MQYIKCGSETFNFEIKPIGKICNLCKRETPVVTLTTQALKLCKSCFLRIQERRVYEGVKRYKMFDFKDRVGIFLSGGKDSSTLAFLLKRLYPTLNIQGIYLNLGIRYYSDQAQKTVENLCEKLNIPLFVYNLPKEEGFSIDEFILTDFKSKICSVCGTIKRYLFSKLAKNLGLTVIATGHHLDDLLSTYLTLFFQGDFESIKRLAPVSPPIFPGQAKKIKPLFSLPEREILYLALLEELPLESCSCPHGEITPSKKVKKWLEDWASENKTFKNQVYSVFLNKFIPLLSSKKESEAFFSCLKCGEYTSSPNQICGRCRRISLLERIPDRKLEFTREEWFSLKDKTNWVIFDVREKEDYLQEHLEGAKWVSPNLVEDEKALFKTFKPYKDKNLLFYCYTGRLSYLFVLKLRKLSFKAYNLLNSSY
ncbi:MAG: asparagine synthase-related protein [Caldimicrobium sp.]|nr:asparagine synthase-related protein [Caldimicrobium sp.]MCX7873918.1 asparagine synthase-related protein [Caldimicrobium sp.]MDW8094289.1 ATP-binding protein [Caldimicrobium sp.]